MILELVILPLAIENLHAFRRFGLQEQAREVEALGLPVIDDAGAVEQLHLADQFVEAAIAEGARSSRTSSATKKK
jgi:hypothetical protein